MMGSGGDEYKTILKSFRLIRLIRIIKLYNYAVKSNAEAEEAKLREQQKMSNNLEQAKLARDLEPSSLGSHLSDFLTRRLVLGILMLLMVLPLLSFKGENHSAQAGLRELYKIGTSNCKHDGIIDPNTLCNKYDWVTKEGFKSKLRNYVDS